MQEVTWTGSNTTEIYDFLKGSDSTAQFKGGMNAVRLTLQTPAGDFHIPMHKKLFRLRSGKILYEGTVDG